MAITVHIPSPLRQFTNNRASIAVSSVTTVGDLFTHFETEYPILRERICEAGGKVRRFVNVYVNAEDIRLLGDLQTPLKDGDEVMIIPSIAGG